MTTPNVTWTDESGSKHQSRLYLVGTEFKELPAVYIFTKQRPDKLWAAIYIGETGDLSTRFDDHHAMECIEKEGATHICVLTKDMGKKKDRKTLEDSLIEKYSPPCNG